MHVETLSTYSEYQMEESPNKLTHDGTWKDPIDILVNVVEGILDVLNDSRRNPAFSEGTYVTNIIVPAIRATLRDLPFEKSSFIST